MKCWYSRHGFLMYPIAARSVGATPVAAPERALTADVDDLLARVSERTRVVVIANPEQSDRNLPASQGDGAPSRGAAEEVLLVIDAAYAEYVTATRLRSWRNAGRAKRSVVMLRTFSKLYGLASLRLGWAYCPAEVADVLNRLRGPFNVPGPTLAAGISGARGYGVQGTLSRAQLRCRQWFAEALRSIGLIGPSERLQFRAGAIPGFAGSRCGDSARLSEETRHSRPRHGGLSAPALPADHHRP